MAVFRIEKTKDFTIMSNHHLRNIKLSLKAKGLLSLMSGERYLTTKYGHCSELLVSVGQEVKAGDVIAKVGNTGNSTGPHLHLEVLVDNQYLNPLYFAATGG